MALICGKSYFNGERMVYGSARVTHFIKEHGGLDALLAKAAIGGSLVTLTAWLTKDVVVPKYKAAKAAKAAKADKETTVDETLIDED